MTAELVAYGLEPSSPDPGPGPEPRPGRWGGLWADAAVAAVVVVAVWVAGVVGSAKTEPDHPFTDRACGMRVVVFEGRVAEWAERTGVDPTDAVRETHRECDFRVTGSPCEEDEVCAAESIIEQPQFPPAGWVRDGVRLRCVVCSG